MSFVSLFLCSDVRIQLGAHVEPDDLSDDQITSGIMLGAVTDYVFERVREDLDLDLLSATERPIAERFQDETPEDISAFINTVLKPHNVVKCGVLSFTGLLVCVHRWLSGFKVKGSLISISG